MLVAIGPWSRTSSTGSAITPNAAMMSCAGSEPLPPDAIAAPRKASQMVGMNMPRKVVRNTCRPLSDVRVKRV